MWKRVRASKAATRPTRQRCTPGSVAANLPATTSLRFDALGRSNVGGTNTTYDVTPADTNLCRVNGGDLRCMRVVVTPAGRIRMCDPSIDAVANPNDTRAC